MRKYSYVSADSHLEVPPTFWRPHVDAKYREWAPDVVKLPNGGDAWKLAGKDNPVPVGLNVSAGLARGKHWENLKITGISYADNMPGTGTGEQRLKEMDLDKIDAEILFPAVAGQRALNDTAMPNEAYLAIVRGYNDWLSKEYCAVDYDRLLGCALLPVTGVEDAAAELRRVAKLPGIRTVVLHTWPNGGPKPDPEKDAQFWEAAVETGLPLSAHISFGGGRAADLPPTEAGGNWAPINHLMCRIDAQGGSYAAMQLITSRVFDNYPSLRFAFAETGASWVPFFMEAADSNYMRHHHQAKFDLAHEPSWYIKRHFLWGIQDDFTAVKWREDIGVEHILWATDFPHAACDWPLSMDLVDRMFAGVPANEKYAMCAGNAIKFYKLN